MLRTYAICVGTLTLTKSRKIKKNSVKIMKLFTLLRFQMLLCQQTGTE